MFFFTFSKFLIIKVACDYFRKFGERQTNKEEKTRPHIDLTKLKELHCHFGLFSFSLYVTALREVGLYYMNCVVWVIFSFLYLV